MTVKIPSTWKHHQKCLCILCIDPALERIHLACYVTEAANRLRQGQTSDADKMLSVALKQTERLANNASKLATEFKAMLSSCVKIADSFASESVYQPIFDLVRLYQCETALVCRDAKRFAGLLTESQKSLSCGSYHCQAGLLYVGSIGTIRWASTAQLLPKVQLSDVDLLCAGIGRLNVVTSDESTPTKVTPTAETGSRELSKARRGRKTSSNTEAPVLSIAAAPIKKRPVAGRSAIGKRLGHSVTTILSDDVFEVAGR